METIIEIEDEASDKESAENYDTFRSFQKIQFNESHMHLIQRMSKIDVDKFSTRLSQTLAKRRTTQSSFYLDDRQSVSQFTIKSLNNNFLR